MPGNILLLSLLAILEGITVKLICTHNDFSEITFGYFFKPIKPLNNNDIFSHEKLRLQINKIILDIIHTLNIFV